MYRNQLVEYMKHRTNWELITKANNDGQKTINFIIINLLFNIYLIYFFQRKSISKIN